MQVSYFDSGYCVIVGTHVGMVYLIMPFAEFNFSPKSRQIDNGDPLSQLK